MRVLTRNRIKCNKCGDIIESKTVHDFQQCSCGACFVDGGLDYQRIGGNFTDWEDLSEWETVPGYKVQYGKGILRGSFMTKEPIDKIKNKYQDMELKIMDESDNILFITEHFDD